MLQIRASRADIANTYTNYIDTANIYKHSAVFNDPFKSSAPRAHNATTPTMRRALRAHPREVVGPYFMQLLAAFVHMTLIIPLPGLCVKLLSQNSTTCGYVWCNARVCNECARASVGELYIRN